MDNCGGQNKNNMVLRLAPYLVEAGYFKTVRFCFFIVGHTKNACDRWFNTLKMLYRKQNVWTQKQLIECFKESNTTIIVRELSPGEMEPYADLWKNIYKPFDTNSTQIFTSDRMWSGGHHLATGQS
jgi:hypothetical protein